jgi:hypothetical protein
VHDDAAEADTRVDANRSVSRSMSGSSAWIVSMMTPRHELLVALRLIRLTHDA